MTPIEKTAVIIYLKNKAVSRSKWEEATQLRDLEKIIYIDDLSSNNYLYSMSDKKVCQIFVYTNLEEFSYEQHQYLIKIISDYKLHSLEDIRKDSISISRNININNLLR